LVYHHPPEIEPGTKGTVISTRVGSLYAVQLPNGELHRWFAGFELQPVKSHFTYCGLLSPGSFARILTTEGHPPLIKAGSVVKIVKTIIQVPYYDFIKDDKSYHRWMAEFEIVSDSVVSVK
jgi:hypothetical protein